MTDFGTTLGLVGAAALTLLDAESVVYTPATGSAVTIDALIDRRPIDAVPEELGRTPRATLKIRNHATLGRLASAIDTGGDTVTWKPKKDGTTRTSSVMEILDQDAAFVTLMIG